MLELSLIFKNTSCLYLLRDNIRIYITGGNSRLASHLIKLIPNAVPLTRKPIENAIQTDYSYEELKYLLSDANVVFHIAGRIDGTYSQLYDSNVRVTENVVDAIPRSARLIFASSISVYGKKLKELPATEETPINPDTNYAKTKAMAEEIVLSHKNSTLLRIATLYGENFIEYFKLFKLIERGNAFIFGSGKNKLPLTYAKDVAKAMKNAIKAEEGIYILSAKSIVQEKAFRKVASLLDVEFKPKNLGYKKALFLAKLNSFIKFSSILKEETIHSLSANREFSSLKAEKKLNFNPIHPEKGIRLMVANYKKLHKHVY